MGSGIRVAGQWWGSYVGAMSGVWEVDGGVAGVVVDSNGVQ